MLLNLIILLYILTTAYQWEVKDYSLSDIWKQLINNLQINEFRHSFQTMHEKKF